MVEDWYHWHREKCRKKWQQQTGSLIAAKGLEAGNKKIEVRMRWFRETGHMSKEKGRKGDFCHLGYTAICQSFTTDHPEDMR